MDEDRSAPATKGDIAELRAATKGDIAELRADMQSTKGDIAELRAATKGEVAELKADIADLRADMQSREDRLVEVFRDAQTELLKAFYSFTTSNQQRLTQVEGNEAAVIARLGTLESRVTDLERKINFPPPQ